MDEQLELLAFLRLDRILKRLVVLYLVTHVVIHLVGDEEVFDGVLRVARLSRILMAFHYDVIIHTLFLLLVGLAALQRVKSPAVFDRHFFASNDKLRREIDLINVEYVVLRRPDSGIQVVLIRCHGL